MPVGGPGARSGPGARPVSRDRVPLQLRERLPHRLRDRRRQRFKFRRQHPIGPYVADFWCAAVRVVVELDGRSHADRIERDAARDAWMLAREIRVLRFKNHEVEENIEAVLMKIADECERRIRRRPSP